MEGKVLKYKIFSTVGGQADLINKSLFSNRFTFVKNFNKLFIIPFPHVNLVDCIGMTKKSDYLIWREKNGFFTALDKYSNLRTWSLVSGKFLYNEVQSES